MRRIIVVLAVGSLLAPLGARAEDNHQCIAVGALSQPMPTDGSPWQCEFVATGPSQYVASTVGPFAIAVYRDGGWHDLVRRETLGTPQTGILPTAAGERVSVNVSCYDYANGANCRVLCSPFNGFCTESGTRTGLVAAGSVDIASD